MDHQSKLRLKVKTDTGLNILCTAARDWKVANLYAHLTKLFKQVTQEQDQSGIQGEIQVTRIMRNQYYIPKSQLIGDIFSDGDEITCVVSVSKMQGKKQRIQIKKQRIEIKKQQKMSKTTKPKNVQENIKSSDNNNSKNNIVNSQNGNQKSTYNKNSAKSLSPVHSKSDKEYIQKKQWVKNETPIKQKLEIRVNKQQKKQKKRRSKKQQKQQKQQKEPLDIDVEKMVSLMRKRINKPIERKQIVGQQNAVKVVRSGESGNKKLMNTKQQVQSASNLEDSQSSS